ncbi:hypothetical protein ES708_31689 [subsurface metagenome]
MEKEDNYTDQQYQALKYSYEQFDKNVLFIASGALGISFAFVEKIIPDLEKACKTNLLINSWYFFAGVIFISLIAHFISVLANRWAIANEGCKNYDKITRSLNWSIRLINLAMIVGLLWGLLLLINFVKLNIT